MPKKMKLVKQDNVRVLRGDSAPAAVLDLDAIEPGPPFRLVFGGRPYQLCDLNDLPVEIVQAADSGDLDAILTALRLGLGDAEGATDEERAAAREEWSIFHANTLTLRKANVLFMKWLAHSGLSQGE